jgi:hypothetical protein
MPKRRYGIMAISLMLVGMFAFMIVAPAEMGGATTNVSAEWSTSSYFSHIHEIRFYDTSHQWIGSFYDDNQADVLYLSPGTTIDYVQYVLHVYPQELSTPATYTTCLNIDMGLSRSTGTLWWWSGWTVVSDNRIYNSIFREVTLQSVDMNFVVESGYDHHLTATLQLYVN